MRLGVRRSLNSGLIHHWKLDEETGLVAKNSVNASFDGALVDMTGNEWGPFVDKNGVALDGANDNINCGNISGLTLLPEFTACCYLSSAALPAADEYPFSKRAASGGNRAFYILLNTSGKLVGKCWRDSAGGTPNITTTTTITAGAKFHVAIVFRRTSFEIWVNGVMEDSTSFAADTLQASSVDFYIGSKGGGVENFNGSIDDMAIYKRALSTEELEPFKNRLLVA